MKLSIAAGLAALLASSALAQAPGGEGKGGRLAACRADIKQHCAGVEAGGGRKMACLQESKAKLSPECAAVVEQRAGRAERKAARGTNAPSPSPKQADVPAGSAASPSIAGAQPHAQPKAPEAAAGVGKSAGLGKSGGANDAKKAERRAKMAACRTDSATFCQNVVKGGGRRIQCLKQNEAQLSPECRAAVSSLPERGSGKGRRAAASGDAQVAR